MFLCKQSANAQQTRKKVCSSKKKMHQKYPTKVLIRNSKNHFSVAENVTKCQIKVSGKNRLFLTTFYSRLVSMRLPGCGERKKEKERKKENDFAVKNDKRAILQY